ncbi:hypothetical protein [Aquibacillus sediminis]|uniref:hypothetical protein n=1 Tax=Aquibacillus sediminis TaxID=2574734 RepID=UPI001108A72B|nr:hypothetical protein [Aquibacillus sediminis]
MTSHEKKLGIVLLIIVLLSYIIPYMMLSHVASWYGSFLFWSIAAIVIIIINYLLTRDWGDNE